MREFSEIAPKETSVWFDAISEPPMFGGATLQCMEIFGASAFTGTLEHAADETSNGWEYFADDMAGTIIVDSSCISFPLLHFIGSKSHAYTYYINITGEKFGLISTVNGSVLKFNIEGKPQSGRKNKLFVHYLHSYS